MTRSISEEGKRILEEIKRLQKMRELDMEKICVPGGYADKLAKEFKNLKPTQLRKFFQEIKTIERNIRRKEQRFNYANVVKIFPLLAYAKGRNLIPDEFYRLLKSCLSKEKLETNEDFLKVAKFMTAILAYHKLYYKSL